MTYNAQQHSLILGLGQTGLAVARYLKAQNAQFSVMDSRGAKAPGLVELQKLSTDAFIEWNEESFTEFDELIVSPGISVQTAAFEKAREQGVAVIGDIELFAQVTELPIIAITGSNGKSTVTELVGECLTAAGHKPFVGGNIGVPVMEMLTNDEFADCNIAVLELSSFQLETTFSLEATAATVLNVSADHLDRYDSFDDYAIAKQRIYAQANCAVENTDDALTHDDQNQAENSMSFGLNNSSNDWNVCTESKTIRHNNQAVLTTNQLALQGIHNALNVAASFALLDACQIAISEDIIQAACSYQGLPHRCQKVAQINGVTFIDDSKATNVGATLAALASFEPYFGNNIVLIAGGDAKGADLSPLATQLAQIKSTIVFGKDKAEITALNDAVLEVENLEEAVKLGAELSESGDLVLLSPACASLDMFTNYQERGLEFQEFVRRLA